MSDDSGELAAGMNVRYVVLHHTLSEGSDHYDLMMEVAGRERLITWRVPRWGGEGDLRAVRIEDHRKAYLTFEGEISGNRGRVKRVEQGLATVVCVGEAISLRLANERLISLPPG